MFAVKGSSEVEPQYGEIAVGEKRRSCARLAVERETTVDQTLVRGLVAVRAFFPGLSSV
jgi:hypothetical protein